MRFKFLLFFQAIAYLSIAQPTMDGTFDGVGVWGSPVAVGNGVAGWADANAQNIYLTQDATYIYLGAEVVASDWMAWAFIINTGPGGAAADSWARAIDYAHTNLPDYTLRGTFNSYGEIYAAASGSWVNTTPGGVAATEFGEGIVGTLQSGFVEVRIAKSAIGSPSLGDIQFYITGNSNDHGSFDAVPNDNNATSWNHTSSRIQLGNYASSLPLPVELTEFDYTLRGKTVELVWKTATETNCERFEIQRSGSEGKFQTIGQIMGAGNSVETLKYLFNDDAPLRGNNYYRLKQIDYDGEATYSSVLNVPLMAIPQVQIGPNPASDKLNLSFEEELFGEEIQLNVLNMNGQTMLQWKGRTALLRQLDIRALPASVYILQVQREQSSLITSVRFVKE